MIYLQVRDYCQSCLDFNPSVTKPQRVMMHDGEMVLTDTIVECEHKKRCEGIRRYLEQQLKGEVEASG